jgi:hypothetical protein
MSRPKRPVKVVLTVSVSVVASSGLQGTTTAAAAKPEQQWKAVQQSIERMAHADRERPPGRSRQTALREYQKRVGQRWLSSFEILKLAAPELLENAMMTEDEIQSVKQQIGALQKEREALGKRSDGTAPDNIESNALGALLARISKATARNGALHEQREKALANTRNDICEKLKAGRLIARGYVSPARSSSKEKKIPAGHWRLIRFNPDLTEAASDTIKYIGITVAKARAVRNIRADSSVAARTAT